MRYFITFIREKLKLRGIFIRFILLLFMPIVLIQLVNAFFFYDRHWESVSHDLLISVKHEIRYIYNLVENNKHKEATEAVNAFDMEIEEGIPRRQSITAPELIALNTFLYSNISPDSFAIINKQKQIKVYMPVENEDYTLVFSRRRVLSPTTHIYIISLVVTALVILLISLLFLRNQVRTIVKLSKAADHFGKGQHVQKISLSGPFEIRSLARSFIRMQERISRQIKHRRDLLTHISHDLRTPLTRLKLKLETMQNAQEAAIISEEILEMERMLNSYLEFAKAEGNEHNKEIDIVKKLKTIISHFHGRNITFKSNIASTRYSLKPIAFERAMNNIIENAVKYSKNSVNIVLQERTNGITIIVEDDGAGIKKELQEELMQPFRKGKESSSYGLGLAIVKTIIHSHGGDIKLLSSSKLGGLKVEITLPN